MTKLRLKEVMWLAQSHLASKRFKLNSRARVYFPYRAARNPTRPFQTSYSRIMCFCFLCWLQLNRYVLIVLTREARYFKFLKLHQSARNTSKRQRGGYSVNQWATNTVRISKAVSWKGKQHKSTGRLPMILSAFTAHDFHNCVPLTDRNTAKYLLSIIILKLERTTEEFR